MWLSHEVVALFRKWDFYLGLFGKEELGWPGRDLRAKRIKQGADAAIRG